MDHSEGIGLDICGRFRTAQDGVLSLTYWQAVYRSLLHLSWIDKLVDNIKTIFVDLYGDQLKKPNTTLVECPFDDYFDQQIRELEKTALNTDTRVAESSALIEEAPPSVSDNLDEPPPLPGLLSRGQSRNNYKDFTSNESTPIATPDTSRPSTPASHILTGKAGPGGKGSRRSRKAANTPTAYASSGDESFAKKGRPAKGAGPKKGRKWDADGLADEDSDTPLDYSAPANGATSGEDEAKERPGAMEEVDQETWGSKTGKGQFVLKDLDDKVHSILASADAKKPDPAAAPSGLLGTGISAIGGLFRNVVGGKTLTKEDLDKAMKGMEDHLLRKNVAREAAVRLCEGVERELIGVKTGNFESKAPIKELPKYGLTYPRCPSKNPNGNGVLSSQNSHPHLIPRPPPRNRRRNLSLHSISPKTETLCNFHCRR